MSTILQVLGIVFVAIVVVAVLAIYFIRKKLQAFAKQMELAAHASVPRINLVRLNDAEPDVRKAMEPMVKELGGMGFAPAGMYSIEEMPGFTIAAMIKHDDNICAVAYHNPDLGTWVDLWGKYGEETSLTVSTAPAGGELDQMPGHKKIFLKGATVAEAWKKFVDGKAGDFLEISPGQFKRIYEESYAEDMDWRQERGGATIEEIRRIADNMEGDFTDEEVELARRQIELQASQRLEEECIRQYLEVSGMSALKWQEMSEDVFAVHEKMSGTEVFELFFDMIHMNDEQMDRIEDMAKEGRSSLEMADQVMLIIPTGRLYEKLGEVDKPVSAYIFRAMELQQNWR